MTNSAQFEGSADPGSRGPKPGLGATRASGGWPRAIWSGVLSLVMPGVGQIHARSWRVGATVAGLTNLANLAALGLSRFSPEPFVFVAVLVVGMASVGLRLWAAVDAVRRSRRLTEIRPRPWFQSTWFAAIIFCGIYLAMDEALKPGWHSFSVPSASMAPALLQGDHMIADTREPRPLPTYGDVVVFKGPRDPADDWVKRVIGLPGDHVQMRRGQLVINGQQAAREPRGETVLYDDHGIPASLQRFAETLPGGYQHDIVKTGDNGPLDNTELYTVPAGHFFVLGDNRDNSMDSRIIKLMGFVPMDHVVGTAGFIYWARDLRRVGRRVE